MKEASKEKLSEEQLTTSKAINLTNLHELIAQQESKQMATKCVYFHPALKLDATHLMVTTLTYIANLDGITE